MRVRYTRQSRDDLAAIYTAIASRDPDAAQRVEDLIRLKIERLASFPGAGSRTSLMDVRRMPLVRWRYAIYYRIVEVDDAVDVLRIVHGATIKNLEDLPD